MLTVTIITTQGEFRQVLAKGESVLQAAWRAGLEEKGLGACAGNCCCATCHMGVEVGADTVTPAGAMENNLLDMTPDADETSRLGCQMRAQKPGDLKVVWRGE